MDTAFFLATLATAIAVPLLALAWLRPILLRVLAGLCDAPGGAQFWLRSAQLLAASGTVLLVLSFGPDGAPSVENLRRVAWLVMVGTFATVAFIARSVWGQVLALTRPTVPAAAVTVPEAV